MKKYTIIFTILHLYSHCSILYFFFNDPATTEIYTLSLHDALPIFEIHHHRLVVAADHHAFERLAAARIDLLVGHERRDIDEVARIGFGGELEPLAPAHPRLAAQHVDDALELAMMVRSRLGVGVDGHRTCPDLLRADARIVDRRLAIHARSLRCVRIESVARDHPHAVMFPFRCALLFADGAHGITPRSTTVAGREMVARFRGAGNRLWPGHSRRRALRLAGAASGLVQLLGERLDRLPDPRCSSGISYGG